MTFPTPANHGSSCRKCRGTGWVNGPPIRETHNTSTSSVSPCTHDWWRDEPELPEEPLHADHPRAQAAFAKGYAAAIAERDAATRSTA